MAELTTAPRARSTTRALRALLVCALLAVAHTWPLARDLGGLSRHDNADTTLNAWIVAWVAHALPRAPVHVFDAPIFHPDRRTLAYSEPLLVPGALAWPLRAAGLDATATYNLLALAGYALSAWAMWRLVAAWTGDEWAGAVAGAAYAFNAHLLTRFAHLQALHAEFLPLVLLAVDGLARRSRPRDALWLACGLVLTGLTSIYQLTFTAFAVVAAFVARAAEWRSHARHALTLTGLGISAAVAVLLPVLWQYLAVSRDLHIARSLGDAMASSATWRDYLATAGRLHYAWWSAPFTHGTALFPGVTVVVLAALAWRDDAQRGRRRMLAAVVALAIAMSLGPRLPTYGWLYDVVPLLQATRVTSRWGGLALAALAGLAGLGLAAWRVRLGDRRGRAVAIVALALVTIEAWRAPMSYTPTPAVPAVYRWIGGLRDAVLLEYPLFPANQFNLNAPYLLAQTTHFQPIVAGYSGVSSPAYSDRHAAFSRFPDDTSRAAILAAGVTHVVVHVSQLRAGFGDAALDSLNAVPWLERAYDDGASRVYRVRAAAP